MYRGIAVFGMICVLLAALGCNPATGGPGAAQRGPGTLTILGAAQEDYIQGIARAFEAETGVKTSYVRLSSGEALAKLRADKSNPQFSVWWGGPADGYIAANNE